MRGKITILVALAILVSGCTQGPGGNKEYMSENLFEKVESGEVTIWESVTCNESGPKLLGTSPLALENIWFIQPMGNVGGSHVLPTDHQYWHMVDGDTSDDQNFEIRAPADGTIVYIGQIRKWHTDRPEIMEGEYHIDHNIAIEYSCTLSTYMIHIDKLRDDIAAQVKWGEENDGFVDSVVHIPVKEGEVIGWVSGGKFDFSVHDTNARVPGFIFPEHYFEYIRKVYTVDSFDYFEEPLGTQLKEKSIRKVEPRGGKIDYDIEGRLIGSWFRENTNWHRGLHLESMWRGHLAISYDYVFPQQLRISLGDYNDKSAQFTFRDNAMDPADVGIETGPVKYEYLSYQSIMISERGIIVDPFSDAFNETISEPHGDGDVRGIMIFQVLEGNKMRMEIFIGKTLNEVSGFTENARIYER